MFVALRYRSPHRRPLLTLIFACTTFLTNAHAAASEPFRPILFIPGILGTQLLDDRGEVVWGSAASFRHFAELEIAPTGPVARLHAGPLIQKVSVLGPFWAVHQYDGLLETLHSVGFREGSTLFVFTYDWRLSNFDNANNLKAFVASHPPLRNGEFDILAHSMGGLIARIYLQDPASAAHVKRLIGLGVPVLGSMNALSEMAMGWSGFDNYIAGGIGVIRRVLFSFTSVFELMPRYPSCCRIGSEASFTPFDPTDPSLWRNEDWLPPEDRSEAALAKFQNALQSARRMSEVLKKRLPSNVEEVSFAGDRIATNYYLYVDANNRSWKHWRFSKAEGDGTVPVWSAANSFDLTKCLPSFADHATLFNDQWVTDKLRLLLNKHAGPPQVRGPASFRAATKGGETIGIDMVETSLDRMFVGVGESTTISIFVRLGDEVPKRGDFSPHVMAKPPEGSSENLLVTDTSNERDLAQHVLRYSSTLQVPVAGAYSIIVTIPGLGEYVRDVIGVANALPKQ